MTDDTTLLIANVLAFAAAFALVGIKSYMRLWRTPDERSIFVLVVGLLVLLAIGVGVRFGMPDDTRYLLLKFAFPTVTVAAAYRFKVHLDAARATGDGQALIDAADLLAVVSEIKRLIYRMETLPPCPNPDCMAERAAWLKAKKRLPTAEQIQASTRVLAAHHAHDHQHTDGGAA